MAQSRQTCRLSSAETGSRQRVPTRRCGRQAMYVGLGPAHRKAIVRHWESLAARDTGAVQIFVVFYCCWNVTTQQLVVLSLIIIAQGREGKPKDNIKVTNRAVSTKKGEKEWSQQKGSWLSYVEALEIRCRKAD